MAIPQVASAVEVLSRTPAALRALLGGLSTSWTESDEGPDTFSPRDVLGHLIHGEETDWIPRIRIILEHGEARPFDPFDRFAFREAIRGVATEPLLDRFAASRDDNLRALESFQLGEGDLSRRGTHPQLGAVTLGQLLDSWVVHDLGHVRQVVRVMARRHRSTVGPWKAFLSILNE